jgi:hypothetical protein
LPGWTADLYRRAKIALLTGWTFDYIDRLGVIDQDSILQIHEAENALMKPKKVKKWP